MAWPGFGGERFAFDISGFWSIQNRATFCPCSFSSPQLPPASLFYQPPVGTSWQPRDRKQEPETRNDKRPCCYPARPEPGKMGISPLKLSHIACSSCPSLSILPYFALVRSPAWQVYQRLAQSFARFSGSTGRPWNFSQRCNLYSP